MVTLIAAILFGLAAGFIGGVNLESRANRKTMQLMDQYNAALFAGQEKYVQHLEERIEKLNPGGVKTLRDELIQDKTLRDELIQDKTLRDELIQDATAKLEEMLGAIGGRS